MTMVYVIKMHSICTKIKGNNFILTTLHQSKSIWYKYDDLPIWPTHIATPIQNIWQGINIDIVQIVANVSLLPNNVTPTDISYFKKKQYISIHFDNKMISNRLIYVYASTKISFLSYPIQNKFIIDNTTSISQSTHGPLFIQCAYFHP